jgi:trehalose synthase
MPAESVHVIPPSIDPSSPKNEELTGDETVAILTSVGLLSGPARRAAYRRRDGTTGHIGRGVDIVRTGPPPDPDAPLVVQVSRWDRLKDMPGVLQGFADFVVGSPDAHLVLAGPVVTAVADDPEGASVLAECWQAWRQLPHHARTRVALACIPMADGEENAVIVNALQRHASIVVQKSLAEGFGLTVAEAMFKRRAVVASAVGGIVDQIVDGQSGLLIADPSDLDAFENALSMLMADPGRRALLGKQAHDRVVERFLPDSHLLHWSALVSSLVGQLT